MVIDPHIYYNDFTWFYYNFFSPPCPPSASLPSPHSITLKFYLISMRVLVEVVMTHLMFKLVRGGLARKPKQVPGVLGHLPGVLHKTTAATQRMKWTKWRG
jgi:hypothetical protein